MQTIMITGGSGSIGKGIAKVLLNDNYRVILIGRNPHKLFATQQELELETNNKNIITYTIDIRNEVQVASKLLSIWESTPIDGLVNAAGFGEPIDYFSSLKNDWDESFQSKLWGTINMTKNVAKLMMEHEINGKIIIINGTFCYDPNPDFIINSTVNAALSGFAKAASKYLGTRGICLNVLNPWITESESWQKTATNLAKFFDTTPESLNENFKKMNPLKRFTDVNDIGHAVSFLLNKKANYINGASINLDGGASIGF
ncbi:SDR family oxidoreductase [Gilliamella sp. B14384G15]|uniref:SDR family oxidoreductase n=1 Tax=unclassified Gilliamella TaxID=2685620 RepID=UPI0018DB3814|nr:MULTISPECIES: SDR family oxidoreductase [unclassified Gilliamella]MBI0031621.1 SDR family oxidoreductase [Gilliamella sp. B14384G15]MBI0058976.1 SDR family oxidoreductase [Gilliamella sp. B14384G12]